MDKKERNKILGAIGFLAIAVLSGTLFMYFQITGLKGQ